ncbi:hypothetical protein [Legionella worsleiensis]|nr:hypothetical protein [Legionella worsleiensis]
MTTEIITTVAAFASEFSRPTLKNIQTLLIGATLCSGVRRVSSVLRIMGLASIRNFSKYHCVLNRAEWNGLALAKILLGLLIKLVSVEIASWYDKKGELTFSDILLIARRSIGSEKYFSKSDLKPDLDKCIDEKTLALIYQLSSAA